MLLKIQLLLYPEQLCFIGDPVRRTQCCQKFICHFMQQLCFTGDAGWHKNTVLSEYQATY